jgi:hypothetical protein
LSIENKEVAGLFSAGFENLLFFEVALRRPREFLPQFFPQDAGILEAVVGA